MNLKGNYEISSFLGVGRDYSWEDPQVNKEAVIVVSLSLAGAGNMGSGSQSKGNLSHFLELAESKPRHETFGDNEGSCRRLKF